MQKLDRDRRQQDTILGPYLLLMLHESVDPGEPTTGRCEIASEEQDKRHPEHAPCGQPRISAAGVGMMVRCPT